MKDAYLKLESERPQTFTWFENTILLSLFISVILLFAGALTGLGIALTWILN